MGIAESKIRVALKNRLAREFPPSEGNLIIDEMGLCQGEARVDIAVVNGYVHGFEIKSEKDTLARLPGQVDIYSRVLDYVTIVTGPRHTDKVLEEIPDWWGVTESGIKLYGGVVFEKFREPSENPNVELRSLVELLWKEEALEALKDEDLIKAYRNKRRSMIWDKLVETVTAEELRLIITETIKARGDWRSDQRLT